MRACVLIPNYEGLVLAAWLASHGHQVTLLMREEATAEAQERLLRSLLEPGVKELLWDSYEAGYIHCNHHVDLAMLGVDVCFLPFHTEALYQRKYRQHEHDQLLERVAPYLLEEVPVVMMGAMPVGAAAQTRQLLDTHGRDDILLGCQPTYFRRGEVLNDLLVMSEVILGGSEAAIRTLRSVYEAMEVPSITVRWMSLEAAELARSVASAMRAVQLSFANEVAALCETLSLSTDDVMRGLMLVRDEEIKVGRTWLMANTYINDDVEHLLDIASQQGGTVEVLETSKLVNEWKEEQEAPKTPLFMKPWMPYTPDVNDTVACLPAVNEDPFKTRCLRSPAAFLSQAANMSLTVLNPHQDNEKEEEPTHLPPSLIYGS